MRKRYLGLSVVMLASLTSGSAQSNVDFWWLGDEVTNPYIQEVVDNFNQEHSDINVILRTFPNESYKTQIQVGLASNQPPDVFFNWAGEDTGSLVREDQLEDLSGYPQVAEWRNTLSESTLDGFDIDSGLYGVPSALQSKYFYYNKAVFEEEALNVPKNFDELLQLCTTLQDRGYSPMSFGNSERWQGVHYMSIFNQKVVGEERIEEDYALTAPEDELFTDPNYVEALQKLIDMRDAGCFTEAANAISPEVADAQFYTGQVVMTYQGTWGLSIYDANDFSGQYGFFRMPPVEGGRGNQNYILAGPEGLAIPARSDNKEAAVVFADYFVSQPVQQGFVELGRIPTRIDALEGTSASPELVATVEDIATAEGTTLWLDVVLENSVSEAYLNVIQEVTAGSKTPEQAMEDVRAAALAAKQRLGL